MSNTNNEAVFVGDLPKVTSANTAVILFFLTFCDPANTQTATLKLITIGHLANTISNLIS
jgi:hypothetical protein